MVGVLSGSVYDLKDFKGPRWQHDPVRMLVMRHWPRGISRDLIDLWVPNAGPSASLLKRYQKKEIDWETFAASYREEQAQAKGGVVYYYDLEAVSPPFARKLEIEVPPVTWIRNYALASSRSVFILCWERKDNNCHRHILKELIEKP